MLMIPLHLYNGYKAAGTETLERHSLKTKEIRPHTMVNPLDQRLFRNEGNVFNETFESCRN